MSAVAPRHLLVGALAFVLLAGCGPKPSIHHGAPSKLGAAPLAPCPALPTGAEPLVQPGATVILGEHHGTEEVPAFVATLACDAAQRGSVIVGLQVPADLTPGLRAYIESAGSEADREALVAHEFWAAQDGRASQAMLSLVDNLRELRRRGRIVDVFGYDTGEDRPGDRASEVSMAQRIARALKAEPDPNRVALILTGSDHAQNDSDRWMAWHLRTVVSDLLTLRYSFRGGTAWSCTDDRDECGRTELPGFPTEGSRPFVEMAAIDGGKWHGRFYLDRATASPPLKKSEGAAAVESPDEARARASEAYQAGNYGACQTLSLAAAGATPGDAAADDLYNAARCAARAGDADAAFAALDKAIDLGLDDLGHLKVDADLAPLHTEPRWHDVLAGVRTNEARSAASE